MIINVGYRRSYIFYVVGHGSIAAIMSSRLKNLNTVARYWADGDIKVMFVMLFTRYHVLLHDSKQLLFTRDEFY